MKNSGLLDSNAHSTTNLISDPPLPNSVELFLSSKPSLSPAAIAGYNNINPFPTSVPLFSNYLCCMPKLEPIPEEDEEIFCESQSLPKEQIAYDRIFQELVTNWTTSNNINTAKQKITEEAKQ
mmetsp:Transcript_14909/g.20832  ORF Transcript_14909/g.20832 Transcript_14909/m.20832 type:complete len:123 (-) Transcript_14909:359-727(-)